MKCVIRFLQGRNTGSVAYLRFSGEGDVIFTSDTSIRQKVHMFEVATGN
jgi:hypothetical protein